MPSLKSLIDSDKVAFANRILAIGITRDVLKQRLAGAAYFSDLSNHASLLRTRTPRVELGIVAAATCIQLVGQYLPDRPGRLTTIDNIGLN
jgi:hypothetical protein